MASHFPSTTGLYAELPPLTDEQIINATASVYQHVEADRVVEMLSCLGLIEPVREPAPEDLSFDGKYCARGRHLNIPANRYHPSGERHDRCVICRREDARAWNARKARLKAKK